MHSKSRTLFVPLVFVGLLPLFFNACLNPTTLDEVPSQTSNPWGQGVPTDSAPPLDSGNSGSGENAFCQVSMPSSILQSQELRVTVTSQNLVKFQVSTNGTEYVDLGTSNGSIIWPANNFPAGNYTLRFRGVTSTAQTITCDPNPLALAVIGATPSPPSSGGGTTPPELNGSTYPGYIPVVANNGVTSNFRGLQNPQNLVSMTESGVALKVLDFEAISSLQGTQGQLKFFLPPGTMAFDANIYLYLAYQEGRGALRLYAPPTTAIAAITPSIVDYAKVFSKLSGRAEALYYTAGAPANFWLLSSPSTLSPELTTGGYVYWNFQYPGGQFQRSLWKIYVKASCYEKWYAAASTKWDANGNPLEGVSHTCN